MSSHAFFFLEITSPVPVVELLFVVGFFLLVTPWALSVVLTPPAEKQAQLKWEDFVSVPFHLFLSGGTVFMSL